MRETISEWRAQLQGALLRRQGKALVGNMPSNVEGAAQVRFIHGWLSLHQACDCRYSLGPGRSA